VWCVAVAREVAGKRLEGKKHGSRRAEGSACAVGSGRWCVGGGAAVVRKCYATVAAAGEQQAVGTRRRVAEAALVTRWQWCAECTRTGREPEGIGRALVKPEARRAVRARMVLCELYGAVASAGSGRGGRGQGSGTVGRQYKVRGILIRSCSSTRSVQRCGMRVGKVWCVVWWCAVQVRGVVAVWCRRANQCAVVCVRCRCRCVVW